jgi:hypothetical protein
VIHICEICFLSERNMADLKSWDRAYINKLPDEAFAVIEPAYKQGKTKNKNARHLPHHKAGVKRGLDSKDNIDMPHLRNALARMNQINPVTDSISTEKLRKLAREHLNKHATDLKIGGRSEKKQSGDLSGALSKDGGNPELQKAIELHDDGSMSTSLVSPISPIDVSGFKSLRVMLEDINQGRVTAKDLVPSKDDYIQFSVRALSKVLIEGRWFDLTQGDVLKESVGMLTGLTVYPDHNARIENWLGTVVGDRWDDKSTPPGIDADLKIDAFSNVKIARGLLTDPPAITRISVQVNWDVEKSHDMDDYAFFSSLGKKVDGELVRWIITRIRRYGELSLVWSGADPYAKRKAS